MFIPARLRDNKILLGSDPQYGNRLKGLASDAMVRAWLEGDWTVIEGAYFDCWRYDKHVIEPFSVPRDWARFRAMDWGSAKPFSIGWWAICGDDMTAKGGQRVPRGALVRWREWYGCAATPDTGLKMSAEQVAEGIVKRERDAKDPALRYAVLDPACFKTDGGPSLAERINQILIRAKLRPFHAGDNARVPQRGLMGGWDQVRARLVGENGDPMIFCFSTHAASIRTIPALQHDPDRPEDVNTESEDHVGDEWRYACMSRPFVPVIERVRQEIKVGYGPRPNLAPGDWVSY